MSLIDTPRPNRLHIGIYGRRNSGKSSILNALVNQNTALVSPTAGTTTDPVYKPAELPEIGPCVFIDTAGFDDEGELGNLRVEKTRETLEKTDIALLILNEEILEEDLKWLKWMKKSKIPVIAVLNKIDTLKNPALVFEKIYKKTNLTALLVSAKEKSGLTAVVTKILEVIPEDYNRKSLTEDFVKEGETVLLVMPQDKGAPKDRLILPQAQTIRDLLERRCTVISTAPLYMEESLSALKEPPAVIITDSQVFAAVRSIKPPKSRLTSFSILFAAYKGDLSYYASGAKTIGSLTESSRILIAEACTHTPSGEDIGTVKLPALLRKYTGKELHIDMVNGSDFPEDLTPYSLIIQCGACMFNRKHVISRINRAKEQRVPMTNYGIALAWLNGILEEALPTA